MVLTKEEKELIKELRKEGATIREIAEEIGCSERNIYYILRKERERKERKRRLWFNILRFSLPLALVIWVFLRRLGFL